MVIVVSEWYLSTSGGSNVDELCSLCCPPMCTFLYCCTVTFIDDCSGNLSAQLRWSSGIEHPSLEL